MCEKFSRARFILLSVTVLYSHFMLQNMYRKSENRTPKFYSTDLKFCRFQGLKKLNFEETAQ